MSRLLFMELIQKMPLVVWDNISLELSYGEGESRKRWWWHLALLDSCCQLIISIAHKSPVVCSPATCKEPEQRLSGCCVWLLCFALG